MTAEMGYDQGKRAFVQEDESEVFPLARVRSGVRLPSGPQETTLVRGCFVKILSIRPKQKSAKSPHDGVRSISETDGVPTLERRRRWSDWAPLVR
jgi:hypothetical protein